jgi:hypothetical protein
MKLICEVCFFKHDKDVKCPMCEALGPEGCGFEPDRDPSEEPVKEYLSAWNFSGKSVSCNSCGNDNVVKRDGPAKCCGKVFRMPNLSDWHEINEKIPKCKIETIKFVEAYGS